MDDHTLDLRMRCAEAAAARFAGQGMGQAPVVNLAEEIYGWVIKPVLEAEAEAAERKAKAASTRKEAGKAA